MKSIGILLFIITLGNVPTTSAARRTECRPETLAESEAARVEWDGSAVTVTIKDDETIVFSAVVETVDGPYATFNDGTEAEPPTTSRCPSAVFSPDESLLAVSANGIHLVDTSDWTDIEIAGLVDTTLQTKGMIWDESGQVLAYEDNFGLYLLDITSQENHLIREPRQSTAGNLNTWIVYEPTSFSPDSQWLLLQEGLWEAEIRIITQLETGEDVWSGEEDFTSGCRILPWTQEATTAMSCSNSITQLSQVYFCPLADTGNCEMIDMDGVVIIQHWMDDGNFGIKHTTYPEAGPVDACYISTDILGEWVPADCADIVIEED